MAAGISCFVITTAAYAQDKDDVRQIVVTGQKQQYLGDIPTKDLPQNVQVLSSELLQNTGITRLDDALDLTSGVARQNNFGGLWDSFAIRGFAGDENFPSGFLVNGFNGGRGYGGPRDASDVESIEVLKGPNSALFGRGEPGGTVNIISKKANFSGQKGSFTLSAGSWNAYRVEGDYNMPVTDSFAIRAVGAVEDADSFRDIIHTRKYSVTPSFFARFSDSTTLTYELEYVNQEVPFDRGVVAVNGVLGLIPQSRFLGSPKDGPMKVEVLGHQAQLQHDFSRDWTLLLGFGYRDTSFTGYSSDPELARSRQRLFTDGQTLSRQRRFRDYNTTHMVFRGEISGKLYTGNITHHVIVGADWDKFDIDLYQTRYRPTASDLSYAINIYNPNYNIPAPTPTAVIQNSLSIQKAWGIYFQDQIDITEWLKIRGGGRYDNFHQDITNRSGSSPNPQTETRFSPSAGLVVNPTDTVSLYASYGTGFRPNSGLDFFSNPFKPETSKAYEVGAKYVSPDGRISSTLSLYTMKKNNVLTSDPDPNHAGFSKAIGRARSKGIEFDVNAKLPADFQLYLNYAYTDAAWDEDVLDPNFAQPIRKGDPLINIPKNQFNALLTKDFEVGGHDATLGAGVLYVDKRLGQTATTFFLPSYTLVKLIGSFDLTDNIKISADVNNLFDKRYYASSYATVWVQPGMPRSFHVRASFRF